MSVSTTRARHRAARRPATPLSDLANAAGGSFAVVCRRTAIAAASAGLVVSTFAAPAGAANGADTASSSVRSVDTAALSASARAVLASAPVVTVASDVKFALDVPAVKVVKDPPPPPPPAPVVERETSTRSAATASRSSRRSAPPAAAPAPAAQPAPAPAAAPAPAPAAPAPSSGIGGRIAQIASGYVGIPYVYGGSTPAGFDCSGFTSHVYAQVGITLPRSSGAQRGVGTVVSAAEAQPGDLIWTPGHISIYLGNGMQVDAPRPGKTIQIRSIWQSGPTYIRVAG